MKANFSKEIILDIVVQVRQHGTLYVATDGSMFRSAESAESTLKTKNMIIGDPAAYLGYVKLTSDMVSDKRLSVFAKDVKEFNKLFDDPTIPRMRNVEAPKGRKHAEAQFVDADTVANISSLLGLGEGTAIETYEEVGAAPIVESPTEAATATVEKK